MKVKRGLSLTIKLLCLAFIGGSIMFGAYEDNFISVQVLIGLVFLLGVAFEFTGRKKNKASTKLLGEYIDSNWKGKCWFKDKNQEAEAIAENYLLIFGLSSTIFYTVVYAVLLSGEIYAGRPFEFFMMDKNSINYFFILIFLCFGCLILIQGIIWGNKFKNLLYDRCDPYLCALTLNKVLNFPKERYAKLNYTLIYIIALSIGLTGDYYFAKEYIDTVDEEYGKRLSKNNKVLSQAIKFDMLMYYEYYHEAKEIRNSLYNKKKNIFESKLLESIEVELWIVEGKYKEAQEYIENKLKGVKQKLIRVLYNFQLVEVYKELGDIEKLQQCKEFVLENGNTTYYVQKWPEYKEEKTIEDTLEIAVQINGKVRETIKISVDEEEASVKEKIYGNDTIKGFIDGKAIVKEIYVKGRIFNIVVK